MKKKIIVRGPALSRSGYGEQTRFALRSLKTQEDKYDIYVINTGWGKTSCIWEDNAERRWLDHLFLKTQHYLKNSEDQKKHPEFDLSLQVTIPNEWEKMAPINIGYTAGIETTKVAPVWIEKANMMDKVIVVSNHAKYGFDATTYQGTTPQGQQISFKTTTPIEVVNYAVREVEPSNLNLELETDFNYLSIAQWSPRKNLSNTIKWFIEANHDKEDVGLVLKISIANNSIIDHDATIERVNNLLSSYPDMKCKVYVIHGDMLEEELHALYRHPKIKALISISHGEGYGLPLFEAAYNELPIITCDWSGQCDFLHAKDKKGRMKPMFLQVDYDLKHVQKEAVWDGVLQEDSMWSFAQEHSYKSNLTDLKHNYGANLKRAKILAKYIKEKFTEGKIHSQFMNAMETISVSVPNAIPMIQNTQTPPAEELEEVFVV